MTTQGIIDKLEQILSSELSSEEDVRLKFAAEFFRLLDYDDDCLATEFPIYSYHGKKKLPVTHADMVYFDSPEWKSHNSEKERKWTQDHSLLIAEIKKPSEVLDSEGQAEHYARWLGAPCIISTNGKELIIWRIKGEYSSYEKVLQIKSKELVSSWEQIEYLIRRERVEKIILESKLKIEQGIKIDYDCYLKSLKTKLNFLIQFPLSRLLDQKKSVSTFDLYLETDKPKVQEIKSEELLLINKSAIILGEPGSGKTYLLRFLALKLIEDQADNANDIIPIIIEGKQWGHFYRRIAEFIYEDLKLLVKGITPSIIESELSKDKFIIFIDGYDEIRKERDIFKRELEQFIASYNIKIVLTSREANYHGELSPYFDIWKIKPLSEEQIDEFAQQVTSIRWLSLDLKDKNLLELARLPLYLSMICQLVNKSKRIPSNISLLHSSFVKYILLEYPKQKDPAYETRVPLDVKIDFLSELAKERSRNSYFNDYFRCIKDIQWISKKDSIISEILESGLLIGNPSSYMDYIHPTTEEFFYARSISLLSSDQIVAFVRENLIKDETLEPIKLLVGLLRDQNKQKPLLDYLEENNLLLYLKCLDGRYRSDMDNLHYGPEIEKQYLAQMQSSYNSLLDHYFNKSKILFPPFRGYLFDQSQTENLKVKVVGSLDSNQMALSYKYSFIDPLKESIEPEINPSLPVIIAFSLGKDDDIRPSGPPIPIMRSSSRDGCNYINLRMARLGPDSARDVVLFDLKENLKYLIDKKILINTLPLDCEQLISEIHDAASKAKTFQDKILESIWNYETGIYDANIYHDAFLKIKQHPFVQSGNRKIPLRLKDILSKLEYLMDNSIDISKYVLPEFRTIGNQYTPEQIQERIKQVYSLLPRLYSDMVDTNFPNLRKHLWHCNIYPFRYVIQLKKDKSIIDKKEYTINAKYTITAAYCMPVMRDEDMDAVVNMPENRNIPDSRNEYDLIRSEFIEKLKTFRRFPLESSFDIDKFYITSMGIGNAISDHGLITGVYDLLKRDLGFIIK